MLMVIWIVLSLNFFLTVVFCLCSQITSCFLCLVRMKSTKYWSIMSAAVALLCIPFSTRSTVCALQARCISQSINASTPSPDHQ